MTERDTRRKRQKGVQIDGRYKEKQKDGEADKINKEKEQTDEGKERAIKGEGKRHVETQKREEKQHKKVKEKGGI